MSEPRLLAGTERVWPGMSIIFKTKYSRDEYIRFSNEFA